VDISHTSRKHAKSPGNSSTLKSALLSRVHTVASSSSSSNHLTCVHRFSPTHVLSAYAHAHLSQIAMRGQVKRRSTTNSDKSQTHVTITHVLLLSSSTISSASTSSIVTSIASSTTASSQHSNNSRTFGALSAQHTTRAVVAVVRVARATDCRRIVFIYTRAHTQTLKSILDGHIKHQCIPSES
jgi:hypothetical protein